MILSQQIIVFQSITITFFEGFSRNVAPTSTSTSNQSHRKVWELLFWFWNYFHHLPEDIGTTNCLSAATFGQEINNHLEPYSGSIPTNQQKPCSCVCQSQKEDTPTISTTPPSINDQYLKDLLSHVQKSTENGASRKREEYAKQQGHLMKREKLAD